MREIEAGRWRDGSALRNSRDSGGLTRVEEVEEPTQAVGIERAGCDSRAQVVGILRRS